MKKLKLTTEYTLFDDSSELDPQVRDLMNIAINTRKKAYAPYSKFSVGTAILLDNNEIIIGNNQENAAYPSGMCAERVAIYFAGAKYPEKTILKMAISASSSLKEIDIPVAPCGACRQAISEYEVKQNKSIDIYFMGETGKIIMVNSLKELLPLGFDNSFLK